MEYEGAGVAPSYSPFQAVLILTRPGKTPTQTNPRPYRDREVLFVVKCC